MRERFESDIEKFKKYLSDEVIDSMKKSFEEIFPIVDSLDKQSAKVSFSRDGTLNFKITFENYSVSIDYFNESESHIVYSIRDLNSELLEFNSTSDIDWFFDYIKNYEIN